MFYDNTLLHTVYDYFGEEDFTKLSELGVDASYVSISRLKSSIFDNFWSETMVHI